LLLLGPVQQQSAGQMWASSSFKSLKPGTWVHPEHKDLKQLQTNIPLPASADVSAGTACQSLLTCRMASQQQLTL
jgi:hypothetical protein